MNSPSTPVFRAALGCALAAALGVAAAQSSGWRAASVKEVTVLSRVSDAVDVACVKKLPDEPDPRVAVVAYRSIRTNYWRAFALAPDAGIRVGDSVYVEPAECRLREAAKAASAPLPSPSSAAERP
jgi:hypothetical protein